MNSPESLPAFTPRAQQVLALARKEADRLRHCFVGTEHVLLGLLALGQGVGVNVLEKLGLNLEKIRAEVEKQVGISPERKMIGSIPYTPRVKKVLALAAKEAMALQHTYVGTEHILLGILQEGQGVAARVLKSFAVDIEQTRQTMLQALDPRAVGSTPRFQTSRPAPSEAQKDRSGLPRDRFTPRVRRTFTLAVEEAEQRNQPVVEAEHMLLGLVRMGQGVAASVLLKIGVNAATVAAHLEMPPAAQTASTSAEPPQFGPLVKEVLTFAEDEARALEHDYIGTEHILLGLLRQSQGGACRIFRELYVDPEALRKQVLLAFEVKHVAVDLDSPTHKQLPPSEKDTEMFAKKPSPAGNPLANPTATPATRELVDLKPRYDVYCAERNEILVVHRNVRFLSVKSLISQSESDRAGDFVELEQADGQTFFVAKTSIMRFCESGANLNTGNP